MSTDSDCQLSAADIPAGSMLKIDVQGFERDVVEGASQVMRNFETLLIESSFQPLYEGEWTFLEMVDEMASLGFTFVRPAGFLQDPRNGEFLQVDGALRQDRTPLQSEHVESNRNWAVLRHGQASRSPIASDAERRYAVAEHVQVDN